MPSPAAYQVVLMVDSAQPIEENAAVIEQLYRFSENYTVFSKR